MTVWRNIQSSFWKPKHRQFSGYITLLITAIFQIFKNIIWVHLTSLISSFSITIFSSVYSSTELYPESCHCPGDFTNTESLFQTSYNQPIPVHLFRHTDELIFNFMNTNKAVYFCLFICQLISSLPQSFCYYCICSFYIYMIKEYISSYLHKHGVYLILIRAQKLLLD